jgi:hypothetical protein
MMRVRALAVALALAAIPAMTGCGSTASTSKPMSKEKFFAKAEAICARLVAQIKPIHNTDIGVVAPKIATYERAALDDFNKLTPPSYIADDWQQIINDQQAIADITVKLGEYSKAKNNKQVRTLLTAGENAQRKMLATARADGFEVCSHIA